MKQYYIEMEGNYGYPEGEFHGSDVVSEDQLQWAIREYLMPYIENWKPKDEDTDELIVKTIKEKEFDFCNLGYGEELFIKIKEV